MRERADENQLVSQSDPWDLRESHAETERVLDFLVLLSWVGMLAWPIAILVVGMPVGERVPLVLPGISGAALVAPFSSVAGAVLLESYHGAARLVLAVPPVLLIALSVASFFVVPGSREFGYLAWPAVQLWILWRKKSRFVCSAYYRKEVLERTASYVAPRHPRLVFALTFGPCFAFVGLWAVLKLCGALTSA